MPPSTYSESLRRQRNLVHGQPRRAYLHLHRFVKEAVFAVIRAAACQLQGGQQGSLAGALSELLGQIQEGAPSPSLSDKHAALKPLCQGPGGAADLQALLSKVRSSANFQAYQPLQSAPLAVVLLALDGFFGAFDQGVPCLSHHALLHITKVHTKLPFARLANVADSVQVASAAYLMSPLSAADQELLLLMAAMVRYVARASGPGCEEDLVAIGR
jgi:protein tyrosine phosphatase domain-containing protein 1